MIHTAMTAGKETERSNKVKRLYVYVIVPAPTEVVLLFKLGKNKVCLSTNCTKTEVVLLFKSGGNKVCLSMNRTNCMNCTNCAKTTSFPPNLNNKTTSVAGRNHIYNNLITLLKWEYTRLSEKDKTSLREAFRLSEKDKTSLRGASYCSTKDKTSLRGASYCSMKDKTSLRDASYCSTKDKTNLREASYCSMKDKTGLREASYCKYEGQNRFSRRFVFKPEQKRNSN
jgi:hypothetical protein